MSVVPLKVVDREGQEHHLLASRGHSLMPVLAAEALGIDAVCGGCCVCATCHIYVQDPSGLLPPPTPDEILLLNELVERKPDSRLACQITVSNCLAAMPIHIAPGE